MAMKMNIADITQSDLKGLLRLVWSSQEKQPVWVWGPPGCGKSSIIHQAAVEQFGNGHTGYIESRPNMWSELDTRGVPTVVDGETLWAIPSEFPQADRDGEQGVWFLDELLQAPAAVTNTLSQLLTPQADGSHRLGEYVLPPGWRIVVASNRPEDKAATSRIGSHMLGRFMHVQMIVDPDLKSWLDYSLKKGLRPDIMAFCKSRPEIAQAHNPALLTSPTLRGYEKLSHLLDTDPPEALIRPFAYGTLGEGAGEEFLLFRELIDALPSFASVIGDPDGTPVPDQPSNIFAMVSLLSRQATAGNIEAVGIYSSRLPVEFQETFWTAAHQRCPELVNSDASLAYRAAHTAVRLDQ